MVGWWDGGMMGWWDDGLLVTMSSQTSSSRRNRITCFPGDPRYAAMKMTATAAEFSCLSRKEFLSTAVLDSICSTWHCHRIMHLKKSFHWWLGALVVILGWQLPITMPPWLAKELKLKQSGSAINILSLSFAISLPVSSTLRLLPITHKDSSFQWYHHHRV